MEQNDLSKTACFWLVIEHLCKAPVYKLNLNLIVNYRSFTWYLPTVLPKPKELFWFFLFLKLDFRAVLIFIVKLKALGWVKACEVYFGIGHTCFEKPDVEIHFLPQKRSFFTMETKFDLVFFWGGGAKISHFPRVHQVWWYWCLQSN